MLRARASLWGVLPLSALAMPRFASRKVPKSISSLQLSAGAFFAVGVSGAVLLGVTGGAEVPKPERNGYSDRARLPWCVGATGR